MPASSAFSVVAEDSSFILHDVYLWAAQVTCCDAVTYPGPGPGPDY